jgi:hypothetical protein
MGKTSLFPSFSIPVAQRRGLAAAPGPGLTVPPPVSVKEPAANSGNGA